MQTEVFGTIDGHEIKAVTLSQAGITARLVTYGARLTELWVPDANGDLADVVLGFDDLQSYVQRDAYFGATCGQYANRIAKGQFDLNGQLTQVDVNEGLNHLHGGEAGFDRKIWQITALDDTSVTFSAVSKDGEMGFPGRSTLSTRYSLTPDGALEIEMTADTDKLTVMNIVNHAYFNLAGQGAGDVLGHELQIAAQFYTPVDDQLLATGEVRSVAGTPFDFRTAKPIGQDIAPLSTSRDGGGYDHNWCLEQTGGELHSCAVLCDPGSGRRMTVTTTEPGVQVYTGGFLTRQMLGKKGKRLCQFAGVALETQKFPCSPNIAHFPDSALQAGQVYRHKTRLHFGTDTAA